MEGLVQIRFRLGLLRIYIVGTDLRKIMISLIQGSGKFCEDMNRNKKRHLKKTNVLESIKSIVQVRIDGDKSTFQLL